MSHHILRKQSVGRDPTGSSSPIKALLVTIALIPIRNTVSRAFLFKTLNQDQDFPLDAVVGRLTKEYF
jgi:hypothetical protein